MKPNFLRYITGDAGDVQRMVEAIEVAADFPDIARLQRDVLKEKKAGGKLSGRYRGLEASRSFEPHQALARELGIFEREQRWRITPSVGIPFMRLWNEEKIKKSKYLLLYQFIRFDRNLVIPFLKELLKNEKKPPEIIADVWDQMWKMFRDEMELAEPPLTLSLRKEKNQLKRTCGHHSLFRLRFLRSEVGLNLRDDQLKRIVEVFENYRNPKFSVDYSKIGYVFSGEYPQQCEKKNLEEEIISAYKKFCKSTYTSAMGVFNYINCRMLLGKYIEWSNFMEYLRKSGNFSLHPSTRSDDILFTIKGRK